MIEKEYQLQFTKNLSPWGVKSKRRSVEDQQKDESAIQRFLKAGIIRISDTEQGLLVDSRTYETSSDFRLYNAKSIFISTAFQMEGVPVLREIIELNDCICKVDLKDTYVVIPIHQDSQKYLTFMNKGTVYQYTSLTFGLSIAPRVFSKIMRYAL